MPCVCSTFLAEENISGEQQRLPAGVTSSSRKSTCQQVRCASPTPSNTVRFVCAQRASTTTTRSRKLTSTQLKAATLGTLCLRPEREASSSGQHARMWLNLCPLTAHIKPEHPNRYFPGLGRQLINVKSSFDANTMHNELLTQAMGRKWECRSIY